LQSNGIHSYYLLKIKGLVQGVGFRPFIYRLANEFQLKGWVENQNDGVLVKIESAYEVAENFRRSIIEKAPPASIIQSVDIEKDGIEVLDSFVIRKSETNSDKVTAVSPDIAMCEDCLHDFKFQKHRFNYPFINCTNCGPRFTIIQQLPYDRPNTTMSSFVMCTDCGGEYTDIANRRFHAQPIACHHCGPVYSLHENAGIVTKIEIIIDTMVSGLLAGKIFAIKGLGGFHLMCSAFDEQAVNRLRELKFREGKPFAVMFRSVESAKEYITINSEEESIITSWRRPIVLAEKIKDLPPGVANGLSTLGVMLPYMPFHYLLFEQLQISAVVLTSGNLADEPVMTSNAAALETFVDKVDGVLTYNRDIYNRADDSVVAVYNNKVRMVRRSRGYTPTPILTAMNTEGIFAAGAELVNSFGMGKGNQAIMSQYIGDLKNFETYSFYRETFDRFSQLFKFKPEWVVSDLHPDYLSSQFADELSRLYPEAKRLKVQHHHAHIAAVMADRQLDERVIGVSFDGTGLGTDGKIWGAEVFTADLLHAERNFHFEYIPLPGGDKAAEDPWRMAISYLYQTFGDEMLQLPLPIFEHVASKKIHLVLQMLKANTNCPLVSSAGRLFDAVAAIVGLTYQSSFHAEAPMRLESIANIEINDRYDFEILQEAISFRTMIHQIVKDVLQHEPRDLISGKFHNTMVEVIIQAATEVRNKSGLTKVVLSGGTFQNRLLSEKIENQLLNEGFEVYFPGNIPVNDQGIALGQLIIVAKMRQAELIR